MIFPPYKKHDYNNISYRIIQIFLLIISISFFVLKFDKLKGQTRTGNNHLFAHEAAKIARKANVDKLLLTHFWPSIDKEKYVQEAKDFFQNVESAEEGKKLILNK